MSSRKIVLSLSAAALVAASVFMNATAAEATETKYGGGGTCATGYVMHIQAEIKNLPGDAGSFIALYPGGKQVMQFTNSTYKVQDFKTTRRTWTQTEVYADYIKGSVIAYCSII